MVSPPPGAAKAAEEPEQTDGELAQGEEPAEAQGAAVVSPVVEEKEEAEEAKVVVAPAAKTFAMLPATAISPSTAHVSHVWNLEQLRANVAKSYVDCLTELSVSLTTSKGQSQVPFMHA